MNDEKQFPQTTFAEPENPVLATEAAYYQSWVQQSPYAIITFDENGRVLFWNAAATYIFGHTPDTAHGQNLTELIIPPGERNRYDGNLVTTLEKGNGIYLGKSSRMQLSGKSGQCINADVSFVQTAVETGYHFTAMVHPIVSAESTDMAAPAAISGGVSHPTAERIRREHELKTIEMLFQSIADDAPFPMWIADEAGEPLFLNRAWREFIGPLSSNPQLINWSELIPPDDLATVRTQYYAALEQHLPYQGEFRMKRTDGEYRWIHCEARPRAGNSNAYIGSFVDITDRKQAEQTLSEQKSYFRMLSDTVPSLIWKADREGNCSFFNKAWLEFTGRTLEEEKNFGWSANVHPDDLEHFNRIYTLAVEQREKFEIEYRLKRHDGEYRWLLDRGSPMFSESGEFEGYIGSCMDITKRIKAEQVLQESEERFRTIADAAPVSIGVYDEIGQAVYFNRPTLELLKVPLEHLLGNQWLEYLHPVDRNYVMELHRAAVNNQTGYTCEFRVYLPDGSLRHFYRKTAPRFNPIGQYLGEICISVDITEQRAAIARFRRVFESNLLGIMVWDHDGRIIEANDAFLDIIGYTQQDMMIKGLSWRNLTPHQYTVLDDLCLARIAETGICPPYEKQYTHKDGHPVDVLLGAADMEDTPGEGVAFVLDISERRKSEMALQRAMQRERIRRHILELTVQAADWAYKYNQVVNLQPVAETVGQFYQADRCLVISYVDEMKRLDVDNIKLLGQYCSASTEAVLAEDLPEQVLVQHHHPLTALHKINASNPDEIEVVLREKLNRLNLPPNELAADLHTLKHNICEYWQVHSLLRVGIVYRGKPYGALALHQCNATRVWTEEEVALLCEIAQHIGNAFYQAELQLHEREARQTLEKNYHLIRIVNEAQDYFIKKEAPQKIFENLLNHLLDHTDSKFGFIAEVLYEADKTPYMKTEFLSNIAWNEQSRRLYEEYKRQGMEFHKLNSLYGTVLTSGDIVISNNPATDYRRYGTPEGHPPLESFMGIPLFHGEEMIGVVGIANRPGGYDEALAEELQPYLTACATLITGTRNEELRKKLTRQLKANERALKNYAARLERSNHDLDQFATIASHDLQAPLRKVSLFSEFLKSSAGEQLPLECYDYIDRLQKAVAKMQTLILDLLALSRINRRGKPFIPVNLDHVLEDVLVDLEPLRQQVNGVIRAELLMTIDADDIQMHQILQNLVDNALKFHKPEVPPEVQVAMRQVDERTCEIRVRDNGIGFDEKHLSRIFEVFERLHGESQFEGTGMGLAIVRKIAERHGGSVSAQSEPGQGATFIVTLPIHHDSDT